MSGEVNRGSKWVYTYIGKNSGQARRDTGTILGLAEQEYKGEEAI